MDEHEKRLPIVLFGSASGPKLRRYWGDRTNLGILTAPLAWRTPWCRWWACDNDVFSHRDDPGWWKRKGESNWLRMLDKIDALAPAHPPMFVLTPDVVCDWPRTRERFARYRDELRCRSLPPAIALQDGSERDFDAVARLGPSCVFVGGSVEWKWRHAEAICDYFHLRDIRVHVGRASGPWRVRECMRIGADSCDGTGWGRYADKMLPGLWRVLDGADSQCRLDI
jgi:hypothetical protein